MNEPATKHANLGFAGVPSLLGRARVADLTNGNGLTLEARRVSVRFEGLTAVDSVDETLHPGEILVLERKVLSGSATRNPWKT